MLFMVVFLLLVVLVLVVVGDKGRGVGMAYGVAARRELQEAPAGTL